MAALDLKQAWSQNANPVTGEAKRIQDELEFDPLKALRSGMSLNDLVDRIKLGPDDLKNLGASDAELEVAAPGTATRANTLKSIVAASNDDIDEQRHNRAEKASASAEKQFERDTYFETLHDWDNHVSSFVGHEGKQTQIDESIKLMLSHKDETIEFGIRNRHFQDRTEGEAFMKDAERYMEINAKRRQNHGAISPEEAKESADLESRNKKYKGLFEAVVQSVDQNGKLKNQGNWIDYLDGCFAIKNDHQSSHNEVLELLEKERGVAISVKAPFNSASAESGTMKPAPEAEARISEPTAPPVANRHRFG